MFCFVFNRWDSGALVCLSLLELNFSSELLTLKFYIENMAMKYFSFMKFKLSLLAYTVD